MPGMLLSSLQAKRAESQWYCECFPAKLVIIEHHVSHKQNAALHDMFTIMKSTKWSSIDKETVGRAMKELRATKKHLLDQRKKGGSQSYDRKLRYNIARLTVYRS